MLRAGLPLGSTETWWPRGLSPVSRALDSRVCRLPGLASARCGTGKGGVHPECSPHPETCPSGPGASPVGPALQLLLPRGQALSNLGWCCSFVTPFVGPGPSRGADLGPVVSLAVPRGALVGTGKKTNVRA